MCTNSLVWSFTCCVWPQTVLWLCSAECHPVTCYWFLHQAQILDNCCSQLVWHGPHGMVEQQWPHSHIGPADGPLYYTVLEGPTVTFLKLGCIFIAKVKQRNYSLTLSVFSRIQFTSDFFPLWKAAVEIQLSLYYHLSHWVLNIYSCLKFPK